MYLSIHFQILLTLIPSSLDLSICSHLLQLTGLRFLPRLFVLFGFIAVLHRSDQCVFRRHSRHRGVSGHGAAGRHGQDHAART